MKITRAVYLLPIYILSLASFIVGQVKPTSETIKIGTVDIIIPVPEGMVNEYNKNASLKAHIDGGMEPGNVSLAAYVPVELAKRLDAGAKFTPADLAFYANIFEPQSVANMDFTTELFDGFVARVKQQFPDSLEPLTPTILTRIAEEAPTGRPVNVGNFNKTADTFSVVVIVSGQGRDKMLVTAGTTLSYVMVKKRLLYMTVFKQIKKDTDLPALMDYTRKWTAAIVTANK